MFRREWRYSLFLYASFCALVAGSDWPQWRGPDRSDVSQEDKLLERWPAGGPSLLWTYANTGVGYSGPAVVGKRLFIMGARGPTEYLIALDTATGKETWTLAIGPTFTFKSNNWGDGPRGTPTVDDGRVYALGGQGELVCAEASSGKEMWRISLPGDLGGEISPAGGGPEKIGWGFCESPLVDEHQVICTPGGSRGTFASLDKLTGKVIWRSTELTDPATYASIVSADIAGHKQHVQMTDRGAVGVDSASGKLLWRYLRKPSYPGIVIPTPVIQGDRIYTTAGDGAGCDLIRISAKGDRLEAAKIYCNKVMVNQHGGVLLDGPCIYGYSEGKGWVCQAFATGKMVWSEKRKLGRGSLTAVKGQLICVAESDGTTVLIQASPSGWQESGRLKPPVESKLRQPSGKFWTHPVVANGCLFLRDQELLFCYDLRNAAETR
jgi:outer membrane protein assembly factor BamB